MQNLLISFFVLINHIFCSNNINIESNEKKSFNNNTVINNSIVKKKTSIWVYIGGGFAVIIIGGGGYFIYIKWTSSNKINIIDILYPTVDNISFLTLAKSEELEDENGVITFSNEQSNPHQNGSITFKQLKEKESKADENGVITLSIQKYFHDVSPNIGEALTDTQKIYFRELPNIEEARTENDKIYCRELSDYRHKSKKINEFNSDGKRYQMFMCIDTLDDNPDLINNKYYIPCTIDNYYDSLSHISHYLEEYERKEDMYPSHLIFFRKDKNNIYAEKIPFNRDDNNTKLNGYINEYFPTKSKPIIQVKDKNYPKFKIKIALYQNIIHIIALLNSINAYGNEK